jgi:hypothetical protein
MATEQEILQKHLAHLLISTFNIITKEDILRVVGPNIWEHKGRQLTEGEVKALRGEATAFRDSYLWKILRAELLWLAHTKGYVESKTEADQIAGKLIEYLTNVIDSKLKKMIE